MKMRLLVEVELDNGKMAEALGDKLPEVIASGALYSQIGQAVGAAISMLGMPIKEAQLTVVPAALRSDILS